MISLLVTVASPALVLAEEIPVTDPTTTTEPVIPVTEPDPVVTEPAITEPTPDTTTTETAPPPQGPQEPTGAESTTYTFNEATGLWENDLYTWNPATNQTAPKQEQTYSYNPETGRWDTTEWVYDAPSGSYVPNIISVTAPPEGAVLEESTGPTSESAPSSSLAADTPQSPVSAALSKLLADNDPEPSSSTGLFDLFHNVTISNTLHSLAETGDATVALNTLAGSALSGHATALATIINLMQSSWNLMADSFSTFTHNLFGDFLGDLVLNPDTSGSGYALPDDLTVNVDQNAAINNTITLEANSGDATVTQNTQAGDATSGAATAIANLINAINSSIAAQQSFIGMLNIFGNLNGDILIPPELTETLLAANSLASLDTSSIENSSILADFSNNQSISNNINLDASSGDATVANNTAAGSATSGDAETNLTVLNLTGRQVIGKDALLVFVNVLGSWVGMIVNAPTGSTSAALGGGITGNTNLTANVSDNQTITNNISLGAHSGDATVESNTRAGDATSGDAKAAVNLVNISGSQFALSDWFGILFINVFGTWHGSFGIDTEAGELPVVPATPFATQTSSNTAPVTEVRAFRFTPTNAGTYSLESVDTGMVASAETTVTPSSPSVSTTPDFDPPLIPKNQDWALSIIGFLLAGSLLGTERYLTRRNRTLA